MVSPLKCWYLIDSIISVNNRFEVDTAKMLKFIRWLNEFQKGELFQNVFNLPDPLSFVNACYFKLNKLTELLNG